MEHLNSFFPRPGMQHSELFLVATLFSEKYALTHQNPSRVAIHRSADTHTVFISNTSNFVRGILLVGFASFAVGFF